MVTLVQNSVIHAQRLLNPPHVARQLDSLEELPRFDVVGSVPLRSLLARHHRLQQFDTMIVTELSALLILNPTHWWLREKHPAPGSVLVQHRGVVVVQTLHDALSEGIAEDAHGDIAGLVGEEDHPAGLWLDQDDWLSGEWLQEERALNGRGIVDGVVELLRHARDADEVCDGQIQEDLLCELEDAKHAGGGGAAGVSGRGCGCRGHQMECLDAECDVSGEKHVNITQMKWQCAVDSRC